MGTQEIGLSVASKIPFSDFCNRCELFQNAPKTKKFDFMRNYINYFRNFAEEFKSEHANADVSFYPVLRLLVPQAERERGAYGLKESTLAKILIRVLSISKEAADAKKLLNYKSASSYGDFAEVAHIVLKLRCAQKGTLTVEDVNKHLDNIAMKYAEHVQREVDDELISMMRSMTALEVKWLIRIILKDMKFNIAQNSILKLYHIDAPELFDVSNSLLKVCTTLNNPADRLHKLEIELFCPFRPMLSKRLDIAEIQKHIKSGVKYYLETKFDGERFQIHMLNGRYKYFSRNGFCFTQEYGASAKEGMLTPKIDSLLKPNVKSFILDGEMMGWNKHKKCFGSKGMNFDVKKLVSDSVHQPCFCVFDITYFNNEVLTDKPLSDRLKILDEIFEESEGVLIQSKKTEATFAEQVIEALNTAIDKNEEGIVMKISNSIYKPNSRNAGWFKIKPEYTAGILSELDLLIIGGYYGEGKTKGRISSFLLGVAVVDEPEESTPCMFYSVGRVGIGFTADELNELTRSLRPYWKTTPPTGNRPNRRIRECPPNLAWTKEAPDVWIEPKNSRILQVKATELIRTTAFKTNYTLRFPRVEKIRYDKPWHSNYSNVEKLTTRHININDIEQDVNTSSKSPRKQTRIEPAPISLQLDSKKVLIISNNNDFIGKEFCVLTGTPELTKPEIEKKIIENGGAVVQNAGPKTNCVLVGKISMRVTSHINLLKVNETEDATDVVHVSWLLRCFQNGPFAL
ncbi:DNA ligase 4-like [Ctenocephalides felis]|uniref:DNA ligase 4-like n=1 Tax=Ctenocephalides felis TaxID=7515 RepID=UPI000E6E3E11|nr:DNA ligase 4-like [Ctenocephalides felis]